VIRRLLLTTSTAAWLYGLYALYAMYVTPLVEPHAKAAPVQVPVGLAAEGGNQPLENMRLAELYLPAEEWTREAKYQLRIGDNLIYAQKWERQESSAEIRFEPFALIWIKADGSPDDQPLTIISEAATLRFAEVFDMSHPQPGRIVGGALEGSVAIRGPQGLHIQGRNFAFSESALRLFSDEEVRFAYGPHTGGGYGLQIDFLPAQDGVESRDMPAVSGIRNITLRKKVNLQLAADPPPAAGPRKPGGFHLTEPVQITCDRSFQYQLESHQMTFENHVIVRRPTEGGFFDDLTCELLTLFFKPAAAAPGKADDSGEKENSLTSWFPAQLEFSRLLAEGTAKRPARLTSHRSDFQAEMREIAYDASNREIVLRDPEEVKALQGTHEIHGPELTVLHDPAGQVSAAGCRGAGWLKSRAAAGSVFVAQWQKQLRKSLDPQTALDVVELEGAASFRSDETLGLAGERIKVWLSQTQPAVAKTAPRAATASPIPEAAKAKLERLLALEHVEITSPQLTGHTEHLEVVFESANLPPKPGTGPQAGISRSHLQPALHRRDGRRSPRETAIPIAERRRPTSPAQAFLATPDPAGTVSRGRAPRPMDPPGIVRLSSGGGKISQPVEPFDVRADRIRVRVLADQLDSQRHEVAEVWSEGGVDVRQGHADGQLPLQVQGDTLHLVNGANSEQTLHLVGRPAHFRDRGMHLEGGDIQVDRAQNTVFVLGPGLLQKLVNTTLDGKPLDPPQMLDVSWKERLDFDGRTANFHEQVRCKLSESRIHCQSMQVVLSDRISFADQAPRPVAEEVKIRSVACLDGVELDQYVYLENKLISVRRAKVYQFTADSVTGKTEAQGPGTLVQWSRRSAKRAGLSPTATVKANRGIQSDTSEWEYVQIGFAGLMKGNITERFTTFNDRATVVYGPVMQSTDTIDPLNLPKDGVEMHCDSLQFTHFAETKATPAYITVLATGNVGLEGEAFRARADSISYDESKRRYVLRSLGTHKATIWRSSQPGSSVRAKAEGQRIEYNPDTHELHLDRATGLDGLQ
jgi:lipopolysaccharide export system protein LptA